MVVVTISSGLRARIFEQLQQAYPNEGGGFLLGVQQEDRLTIRDVHPVENVFAAEEQYHRYAMTPADWMKLEDEADAKGLSLVGYYHSHPDHPPRPSEYDRQHAWPWYSYLIVAVERGIPCDSRSWVLSEDRSVFQLEQLEVANVVTHAQVSRGGKPTPAQ